MGFRGEALASVSSVSRLTFTSKPAEQEQAWQAIAEGRDMEVNIQPAAHPQGTTVEVLDLFFNTPARRRFLKTEKTEFQHIDELIKRIALSRFDIAITLKHNNKVVRQYRAAPEQKQQEKRIAAICSEQFMKHALHFEHSDQALTISGWVSDRLSPRPLADVQYCYINGRMIRDKLVNHAIKQVYAHFLPQGMFPGYIIYIECDAKEVDVNVHPSKHEVRFHQARWVHDFISSTLNITLNDSSLLSHQNDVATANEQGRLVEHSYQPPSHFHEQVEYGTQQSPSRVQGYSGGAHQAANVGLSDQQVDAYCDFVAEAYQQPIAPNNNSETFVATEEVNLSHQVVAFINSEYALLKVNHLPFSKLTNNGLLLMSLSKANIHLVSQRLFTAWQDGEVISQPLLLPVRFEADQNMATIAEQSNQLLNRLGFSYKFQSKFIIVNQVPSAFRHAPVAAILAKLFTSTQVITDDAEESVKRLCDQLAELLFEHETKKSPSAVEVESLLKSLARFSEAELKCCFKQPDLSLLIQGVH